MIDRRRERQNREPEAADPSWRRELEQLPDEVHPDRDLWQGIAGRLAPRTVPWWRRLGQDVAVDGLLRPALATVAVVLVLLIGSSLWIRRQPPASPAPLAVRLSTSTVVLVETADAEAELLRLRQELLASLEDRREQVAPETVAMVQETLDVLDAAIAQVRAALAEDPGNVYLNHMLADEYRREAAVLVKLHRI